MCGSRQARSRRARQSSPHWQSLGGTSASSPIIASIYALAGNARTVDYRPTGLGTPNGTGGF